MGKYGSILWYACAFPKRFKRLTNQTHKTQKYVWKQAWSKHRTFPSLYCTNWIAQAPPIRVKAYVNPLRTYSRLRILNPIHNSKWSSKTWVFVMLAYDWSICVSAVFLKREDGQIGGRPTTKGVHCGSFCVWVRAKVCLSRYEIWQLDSHLASCSRHANHWERWKRSKHNLKIRDSFEAAGGEPEEEAIDGMRIGHIGKSSREDYRNLKSSGSPSSRRPYRPFVAITFNFIQPDG